MDGFFGNIEKLTLENKNFRFVTFTGPNSQLVLMSLLPQEDIGMESHNVDQFFRFEQGVGEVHIDGKIYPVTDGTQLSFLQILLIT